ncbi:SH3 domain-containing protein [Qingshengfaniella alkalisoli]|uniref:SH3 domain-containing protein n=1 Tax=Qingshengfaniella alkalisoli TaxID=2599296 RepID=A0A5B8ITX5_9RHOB|nr:SH3 domain-containing protein [Qingshengfaniella alkalisoli]QDY68281.1 SH3 domain-containing protein [Qingshengfaniella alkalisoli]
MGFKLTVILIGVMFAVMYFSPEPDGPIFNEEPPREPVVAREQPTTDDPALQTQPTATSDPTPQPETEPEVAAASPFGQPTPIESDEAEQQPDGEEGSLSSLALQRLSLDDGNTGAVSLADRVRENSERGILAGVSGTTPVDANVEVEQTSTEPSATTQADTRYARVLGTTVNLRAGPSTIDPVLGQVDAGDRVQLLEGGGNGWARIVNPDTGNPVYMSSQFLEILAQ